MAKTKVYLVGNEDSPKNNSWVAMTNSLEEAARLMEELGTAARMKTIVVGDSDEGS